MIAFNWFLIFFPCVFDYFSSRLNYVLKRISYLIELWLISILRRLKFKSFLVVWIVVIFLFFLFYVTMVFAFLLPFFFILFSFYQCFLLHTCLHSKWHIQTSQNPPESWFLLICLCAFHYSYDCYTLVE